MRSPKKWVWRGQRSFKDSPKVLHTCPFTAVYSLLLHPHPGPRILGWTEMHPSPQPAWPKELGLESEIHDIGIWSLPFTMMIELLVLSLYLPVLMTLQWEACTSSLPWAWPRDSSFPISLRSCDVSRGLKYTCETGLTHLHFCRWCEKKCLG